ncbi:GNAT family N-acetyltransferase [Legionella longbeachae]|uniref:Acetyltransferase, GNAT family n=1 Tax=Legionella longbeachae serogroup 1 (strain NSW150) TaxID=661367 RepID=D3HS00_LEGLN|nr:GNAT family N-acetyltransferase [Legionella longbeachae]VEE02181.1 GNAT family acetyltransferase [Legionella oakridgensis]HBD7396577.1 GNAT family N-acetyltransferase [Legionella pneumophila]ARB91517.1 GNAT family N-acetyltransferase [Legionella longbeachae]EEZ95192.1 GNAT family acetyltransferase [Legionella longbeachae D-4968]QIN32062.1 GNAT family N-acetyltransferase [Legionella longbeachae]
MDDYQISRMTRDEVSIAVEWARQEDWNPGLSDAECFYHVDPQGFFAGKLKGQTIAVGSAVIYDDYFAFCGFYIVEKSHRSQGYGIQLTQARLAYVGSRNAGLDGVLDMIDNYARIGYKFAHSNARYALEHKHPSPRPEPFIVNLQTVPFAQLMHYDRHFFPAPRPHFLSAWIQQKTALALGYVQEEHFKGYGVIRKCFEGYKIGPLFADSPYIAEKLLEQLSEFAQGETIYLDIPENNPFAVDLVQKFKMSKVFATARMYLKGEPKLSSQGIYGITTFELG